MYLLYLDESGTHANARHFILAGVSVYGTNARWAADQLDRIQSEYFPDIEESLRFHAAPLRARDGERIDSPFDRLDRATRLQLLSQLYDVALRIHGTFFAVVIEKSYLGSSEDPYDLALEQMLSRFDQFLSRMRHDGDSENQGRVVTADSQYRRPLEALARQIAREGTQWGKLRNLVDIPFFTLSGNSRLLQVADLISNTVSVYGRYESGHATMFDRMLPKFDQDDRGRMHGLLHLTDSRYSRYLPCCLTRRLSAPS